MMRATDTIIGPARGSAIEALNTVPAKITPSRYTPILDYITEVFRLAPLVGIDPAIVVAQSAHETANWTSDWWVNRLNPAGLGITGDPKQNAASGTWQTGTDAARAHIVHLAAYVGVEAPHNPNAPLYPYLSLDPRYEALQWSGWYGQVRTINDLTGKWGVDPNYAAGVVARGNQIFPSLPDQQKGTPTVNKSSWGWYDVAGLSKKIQLPVPLKQMIVPVGQTNQRPGYTRATPGYWVQHETANYAAGADALMHARWLNGGAGGQQLSFHFAVDDGVIYQMIPVDEVTWQAADGNGPGNMSGVSCELCVNQGIDTAKARHNAEALCAGVCAALPIPITADRVKRHWDFNAGTYDRHHCPDQMMTSGYWPTFVQNVSVIMNSGETVPIEQKYPAPFIPDWLTEDWIEGGEDNYLGDGASKTKVFSCRRRWTPAKDTPRLQHAGKDAPSIGPDVKKGESFIGCGVFHSNGQWFILTKWGTRLRMDDMTDRMIPGYPEKGKA